MSRGTFLFIIKIPDMKKLPVLLLLFLFYYNAGKSQIYVNNIEDKRFIAYKDSLNKYLELLRKEINIIIAIPKIKTEKDHRKFQITFDYNTVSEKELVEMRKGRTIEGEPLRLLGMATTEYAQHWYFSDTLPSNYKPKIKVLLKENKRYIIKNIQVTPIEHKKSLLVINRTHNLSTNKIVIIDSTRYWIKSRNNENN